MVDLGGYGGTTVYNRFPVDTPRGNYYIKSLCQVAEFIKASQEDLSLIMPGYTIEEASQKLIDLGAQNVIITLGEKGALYQCKGEQINYVSAYKTRVETDKLNVVGAGDAFSGGFIYEYLNKHNIKDSVLYGNAVASLVLEKEGACVESRMPSSEITELRLKDII